MRVHDDKSLECEQCGFVIYHSTAAAVVVIIEFGEQILLTQRANDPFKGMLAFPGGFVDYLESLEQAIIREMKEELNLDLPAPVYFGSWGDRYPFRDIGYYSCVAYFTARIADISQLKAADDVSQYYLEQPSSIDPERLAFDADRKALRAYLGRYVSNK